MQKCHKSSKDDRGEHRSMRCFVPLNLYLSLLTFFRAASIQSCPNAQTSRISPYTSLQDHHWRRAQESSVRGLRMIMSQSRTRYQRASNIPSSFSNLSLNCVIVGSCFTPLRVSSCRPSLGRNRFMNGFTCLCEQSQTLKRIRIQYQESIGLRELPLSEIKRQLLQLWKCQ